MAATQTKTYRLGLLGASINHSLSPVLHQFLLEKTELTGSYELFDCFADDFPAAITHLKTQSQSGLLNGFNITVPFKTAILPFIDQLSPEAQALEAVNTVAVTSEGWVGYNTDALGFSESLPAGWRQTLADKAVMILGAGGACRSVLSVLLNENVSRVSVACRRKEQAAEIQHWAEAYVAKRQLNSKIKPLHIEAIETLSSCGMLVNASPVGSPISPGYPLSKNLLSTLPVDALVYDLVYYPAETPLLEAAGAFGLQTQGGLPMLVRQGAAAFTHWTGRTVSLQTIAAAEAHMRADDGNPIQ